MAHMRRGQFFWHTIKTISMAGSRGSIPPESPTRVLVTARNLARVESALERAG